MSADQQAPFIPPRPDAAPVPPAPWRVFGTRSYFRLWLAQVISSTGDWIGLIAILAIAARVSDNSGAAVSLVMVARVVPGFFLGTVGGVIIDRLDRRKVMVWCDIGRATLLALLPLVDSLGWLVVFSFALEVLTLLWGPAKDASVPNLVEPEQLASANTLSLVASYGTFPFASIIFSLLAALAAWLGSFHALRDLSVDQEVLALLVDAASFVVSALIVWRLPIRGPDRGPEHHADLSGTFRDIKEGLQFIVKEPRVRGVIVGLGLGLIGGGAMITLGPVFAKEALGGDSATFGALMTALGLGAAAGVVLLLLFQNRLPRETVFEFAVMGTGLFLVIAATLSSLGPAALAVGLVGAFAGTSYVTGFTVLQENVSDELRGRTFATLYTVIRMCLLISLVISPLWADFWDWVTTVIIGGSRIVTLGGADYAFPGVRIALWGGGLITLCAGWFARWSMQREHRIERAGGGGGDGHERGRGHERGSRCDRGSGLGDRMSTSESAAGRRGRFVVIEGGDGSGKSTQVGALVTRLHGHAGEVVATFEPGATPTGAAIRAILLEGSTPVDPATEALLMAADRAQHVRQVITPALARGAWVVSDRFLPSSLAYQGVARGLGVETVEELNRLAVDGLEPDVVVVIDVDDDVAAARRSSAGRPGSDDRLEREAAAFHAAVRAAYRELATHRGWAVVDGAGARDEVAARVWSAVMERAGRERTG